MAAKSPVLLSNTMFSLVIVINGSEIYSLMLMIYERFELIQVSKLIQTTVYEELKF